MPTSVATMLRDVDLVRLPATVLTETANALRLFGRDGNEGFVLWLGTIADHVATIRRCLVPPQNSIQSEDGVGYFIDGETLFEINRFLSQERLRLIAQVHSHPTTAYHSETDDRYAIVTTEGGLSLVVPYFAQGPSDLATWAVYRLREGHWAEVSASEVKALFAVV